MKKLLVLSLIGVLSGWLSVACSPERTVEAGREEGPGNNAYHSRFGPKGEIIPENTGIPKDIRGELTRVDTTKNTITLRVENGMEQTFQTDDQTSVTGLTNQQNGPAANPLRTLIGGKGSEVIVSWKDQAGAKMATGIQIDQENSTGNQPQGHY